ncbi:MAG: peptide ABC transporter substrate-binding protein [Leptospiraceae bacterium]|nr:peptide ABC transporter substrate-binding protein [Leptospiraceae bacterium]
MSRLFRLDRVQGLHASWSQRLGRLARITLSGVLLCLVWQAALPARADAPNEPGRPVLVLVSSDTSIYAEGLSALQTELRAPIEIEYLDAIRSSRQTLVEYFDELDRQQMPLVITIGPGATRAAMDHLQDTVIVFSMIRSPRLFIEQRSHICGVSMDVPMQEYFQRIKEIKPTARNVSILYSTPESAALAAEAKYSDLRNGLLANLQKVGSTQAAARAIAALDEKTDAFIMLPDPIYDRINFEALSTTCQEHSIILASNYSSFVRAGAVFGITPDYSQIGRLTGAMAQRILQRESDCAQESVRFADYSLFYVNEEYAANARIPLPPGIRQRAGLTRLFRAGVTFMQEGKLKSARIVFQSILQKDPANEAARSSYNLVVNRLTGDSTRQLLTSARQKREQQNYAAAIADYRRILQLNPGHRKARAELQVVWQARSESEYHQAEGLRQSGRHFDAIRMYQQAISSYAGNTKAQMALQALRTKESARLQEYLKSGIQFYNRRQYDQSIIIFENVLLLVPGQKQAKEYLRLSVKKKRALEELIRNQ